MNKLALINPEFLKFPEDIQQVIYERIKKGDKYFFLMRKEEIEKELEEEEREKITKPADHHNVDTPHIHKGNSQLITLETLFDTQVSTLIHKGFPKLAGMNEEEFLSHILPMKESLKEIEHIEFKEGHIPFIIVIKNEVISIEKVMPLIELEGKNGTSYLNTETIKRFKPIDGLNIPNGYVYLAVDIETGKTTLGKSPNEAIIQIKSENRFPLTLDEGVALVTHHPEILKSHFIYMSGSCHGDDDVVNFWLHSGEPSLYWSRPNYSYAEWGSASCLRRL